MKFAVAYLSYFENDLKIAIVEADDPVVALVKGVKNMAVSLGAEWLNDLLKKQPHDAERVKEIAEEFFDVDQNVAVVQLPK